MVRDAFASAEEIIVVFRGEVVLRLGLASERLSVPDLLKVVESAGDALVPVCVVWLGLCDRITLKEKGKAAVRFRSGVEIEVEY